MISFPISGIKRSIYTLRSEMDRGRSAYEDVVLVGAGGQKGVKEGHVRVETPDGYNLQTVPIAALTATDRMENPAVKRPKKPKREKEDREDRPARRDQRREKKMQTSYLDLY